MCFFLVLFTYYGDMCTELTLGYLPIETYSYLDPVQNYIHNYKVTTRGICFVLQCYTFVIPPPPLPYLPTLSCVIVFTHLEIYYLPIPRHTTFDFPWGHFQYLLVSRAQKLYLLQFYAVL